MPSTLSTTTPGAQFSTAGFPNFSNELHFEFLRQLDIQRPDMVRSFYTEHAAPSNNSDTMIFKTFALPEYGQVVPEGVEPVVSGITEGDSMSKKFVKYGMDMPYTDESKTFDKVNLVPKFAEALVKGINSAQDLIMTYEFFQGADQTSAQAMGEASAHETKGSDNVAKASASHTVPGTRAAGTVYSNLGALDFSRNNLSTTIKDMQDSCVNENGLIIPCEPNVIFCPNNHALIRRILETLGSSFDPVTNNNTISIYGPGQAYNMQLVVLKKGNYNLNGTRNSGYDYYWGVMDKSFVDNAVYARKSEAEVRVLDLPNWTKRLQARSYMAHANIKWQGYYLQKGVA